MVSAAGQKGKNLSKAGTIKLQRFSAEMALSETASGPEIIKGHSVEGSEVGSEVLF